MTKVLNAIYTSESDKGFSHQWYIILINWSMPIPDI